MPGGKEYKLQLKIAGKIDPSLKNALNGASKQVGGLGTALKKVGKVAATATAAVGAAAAGIAAKSLSTYSDFQQSMANTAAIAGATEDEYKQLEAAAREMGAKTTKSATEAADALGYMALAGWDVNQATKGLEPVLRLSEATQMDLARCSDLVTDSMSAMGLGVDQLQGYLDLCVQTNNKANTTAESLMEAFIGCGGAAKTTGVDMNDLATALGILANNGTKGAEAGTAMNAMLVRMTSKDAAIKAMNSLGVSAFDAQGNFRGLETVLGDLNGAMKNLSTEEKAAYLSKIAGTNYYTEMSYLLDAVAEGADGAASSWQTLEGQLQGSDGALMNMAGQITNTLSGAKDIFMSALQEAQLTIGESISPYAQDALLYLANTVLPMLTSKLGEILPELIEGGKWIGSLAGDVMNDLLPPLKETAGIVFPELKSIIQKVVPIFAKLAKTVLPPIINLVNKLLPPLFTLIDAIFPIVSAAIDALGPILNGLLSALSPVIDYFGTLAGILSKVFEKISPIITKVGDLIGVLLQTLAPAISQIAGTIGSVLGAAFEALSPIIDNVVGIFNGLIDFISNVFAGNWGAAWDAIVSVFGNIFGAIVNIAKVPINAVINAINWVIEKINGISVDIPEWVPLIGGSHIGFSIPTIPTLATGGIATQATLAMVGEGAEPEAILPLSKLAGMLGNGETTVAGDTYNDYARSDSVNFSPTFNFYGEVTKEQAVQAGKISFEEFKRLYQQMRREEQRTSFALA